MLRIVTSATLLTLSLATAQAAEPLSTRIHEAAVKACAPESSTSLPVSHYAAISNACVYRISATTTARYQAEAEAKTKASTAAVSNY